MEGPNPHQSIESPLPLKPKQRQKMFTLMSLIRLLEARPLAFWGGLWASLFLVAIVSVSSLLSPGSGGKTASGAAFGSSSTSTVVTDASSNKNRIPLWLFGAIALTCTAGSVVVSKRLNQTQPLQSSTPHAWQDPPRSLRQAPVRRRLQPFSESEAPLPFSRRSVAPGSLPTGMKPVKPRKRPVPLAAPPPPRGKRVRRVAAAPMPVQPIKVTKRVPRSMSNLATPTPRKVRVTVVPEHENHPLDVGATSVADAMDLRKQRSLSSWL